MSKVHILSPEIISKISAGEVVERPASVVKELIENAIDAQTQSIQMSIKQAGKVSIQIKDTGTGIEPDDIEKIFHRHSTSKLQNLNDLFTICSLGFRGEALYSIASVSDIILRSRTRTNDTGWEIHLRGGKKLNLRPLSMNKGTEIEITELFFNTPARKKFLKSDTSELHQILNIFIPYTLLYPKKHFSLVHNNKTILDLAPEENHINRVKKTLNLKPEHIIEVKKAFPEKEMSLQLLLGDINIQRPRKDMQFIFVNNRPVQNHFISFHLNRVYRLFFPPEIHPFFTLNLTIPPENIDVNIHPTKREVKIKNGSNLIPIVQAVCEQTLMSYGKPKELSNIAFPYKTPSYSERSSSPPFEPKSVSEPAKQHYELPLEQQITFPQETIPIPEETDTLKKKLSIAHFIGTFLNKYIFLESLSSLLVIDQHAAQERLTYEALIQGIESGHIEVQQLLTPLIIQLSHQEILVWEDLKDMLEKIGLQTTLWNNKNIALHTHPQLIKNPELAIRNILSGEDTKPFDVDTIARRACRNSLMAGDKISPQEAQHLSLRLIKCNDPFICPHGRPTVIEIKDKIFEKQFLRK